MITKKILRKESLDRRNNINRENLKIASNVILNKIENMKEFKESKNIFVYLSFSSEIITLDFISKYLNKKNIVVPKIVGSEMELIKITNLENFEKNNYGILEPKENIVFNDKIDLVITPGVLFDTRGYRLGYGKGYYDRYFVKNNYNLSIGIVLDEFLQEKLPNDIYDKKVDIIITEERIIDLR